MALEGWDPLKYEKEFKRDLLSATKKAGRKTGKIVVKRAKSALGKVDRKRKAAIKYKVRRNGTLAHIDSGLDSRAREYGSIARAKPGSAIRVNFDKKYRDQDGDFIAKIGSNMLLFAGEGEQARPIAVLKKTVRRKAVAKSKRLSAIAESEFDNHLNRIEEEISNG